MSGTTKDIQAITARARQDQLELLGTVVSDHDDPVPDGTRTILLFGPREPGFWRHVNAAAEFRDARPDPMDRWSARIIGALAADLGGSAIFPFGGPPYAPFITWALRSGRCWSSPVTLLVHDTAGLMVSFRGAVALPFRLDATATGPKPCDACVTRPCLAACPVGALTASGYDLSACHGYLDSPEGQDCMQNGCAARRACPVSQNHARLPEHSAFHMRAFHK
ncbi:MAG: ferredoxin [Paracoccaceae bacterium]